MYSIKDLDNNKLFKIHVELVDISFTFHSFILFYFSIAFYKVNRFV